MQGWVSFHRKIKDWEWYTDPNVFRLFFHLVIEANHVDSKWRGQDVLRGQHITSIGKLSEALCLSPKQVRTALKKLESTGEVASKGTNKNTVVTIVNYDSYQDNKDKEGEQEGKQRANKGQTKGKQRANKGQTKGKQRATNNNDNNDNNETNDNNDNNDNNNIHSKAPTDYKSIQHEYNSICIDFPKCTMITEKRKKAIRTSMNNIGIDKLTTVFEKAQSSDFLSGRNEQWTSCNIDWLLKPSNQIKVLEGNYDNKGSATGNAFYDMLAKEGEV